MQEALRLRRAKILQRAGSERKVDFRNQPSSKNVKFSDKLIDLSDNRKKHHSASILKKREKSSLQKGSKPRSDSANSMASQGPFDDQSCENSNLNRAIKQQYFNFITVSRKKGKFQDQFFPPVMSSLFSYAARKINKHPNVKWMRISQVFAGRQLIVTNPEGSKIQLKQSTNLSAQFFCLAFNVLKNSKSVLKKMFEDQKISQIGIYTVKIFQGSVWKNIIVDDFIPVIEKEGSGKKIQPVFITHQQINLKQPLEIWPFILQKALAKYYSNYETLQSGNIFDFLQELTNKTCHQFDLQKLKGTGLKQVLNHSDILAFGQTKQSIKVPITNITNGDSVKIHFSLNKQKYSVQLDELSKYFRNVYVMDPKVYAYIGQCPIRQSKQSFSVRQFSLKTQAFCSITLNQKDRKFFQQPIKYNYCWTRVIVVQNQFNGGYRWIDGRYDNQKSITIQVDLQPGDYYVIIMPEWQQRSYDLALIIRTKFPVRLQRKLYQDGMIQQACADLSQRYGKLNQLNTFICSYNCIHEDMGLIIENINNERVKGQIKIVRSIDGLKSKVEIEAVNKEFEKTKCIDVIIKHNSHYTVVLKMKGGIDRQFFQTFDFGGR